ncbi:hypothetical protein Tco_0702880 [Tanacetum coccineum]|uniref:Reverse transcriptase domain-containing protein n=1 Tax=Tanacetum coccineum TaxID=301880 RepID=A0ABQ4XX89_9ASTR
MRGGGGEGGAREWRRGEGEGWGRGRERGGVEGGIPTHYPYDNCQNIRLILFSIHGDDGNPSDAQHQTSSGRFPDKARSLMFLWAEIGESSLTGPELVLDTTDKVVLIKEKLKAARDRQKSCADNRRKPLEFEVGDRVMLKVSPWKGVIRFGKKRFLTSLLDDGRGSGSWMFLFVWSGYAAMRTLLWAGKVDPTIMLGSCAEGSPFKPSLFDSTLVSESPLYVGIRVHKAE